MAAELVRRCTRVEFAEAPLPAGAPPPTVSIQTPLTNGAFAAVDKRALLVGGYSPNLARSLNQVLEYDFATRLWTNHTATAPFPMAISEATMVSVGPTYYLFGGFNDATVVDGFWSLTTQNGEAKGCAWNAVKCAAGSPAGPSARRGHSMVAVVGADPEKARIFVYGGFDGEARLGDMWVFDVETATWREVDFASGVVPPPRDGASLAVDAANNRLILFGGFTSCRADDLHTFDLGEERWVRYPVQGGPSPRYDAFAAVNGAYFVIGLGVDAKGPSGLIAQLHLGDMKWTVPTIEGDEVEGRSQCSYAIVDGGKKVLALGGTNNKKYSSSLYEIELEKSDVVANAKGKK